MSLERLQKRDEQRLRVLRTVYDKSDGSGAQHISLVPRELEMTIDELRAAAAYLHGEGLVRLWRGVEGDISLCLLNAGINEVESTIRNPDKQTSHFEPVVINIVNYYFDHSTIGAVQIDGTGNSADVTQAVSQPRTDD
jgi:hypothetical protein